MKKDVSGESYLDVPLEVRVITCLQMGYIEVIAH